MSMPNWIEIALCSRQLWTGSNVEFSFCISSDFSLEIPSGGYSSRISGPCLDFLFNKRYATFLSKTVFEVIKNIKYT